MFEYKILIMSEINSFNVYDFVTYEYNLSVNILFVKWDKNNEVVNNLMKCEAYQSPTEKRGFIWIDKLKEILNWNDGDIINIISSYPDNNGRLFITWEFNKTKSARHILILGDGYFYKRDYKQDYMSLVKIDCFYNDMMDDMTLPYIFK
jgi:hypothetical protein